MYPGIVALVPLSGRCIECDQRRVARELTQSRPFMILIGTGPREATARTEDRVSIENPQRLTAREDVERLAVERVHEDRDHCGVDSAGEVAVAVTNDDGEYLLLMHDEMGIAILPHGDVDAGDDWAATAREATEALTGVSIAIDDVAAVRTETHVVEGESEPHATTRSILFRASPTGGDIQACKRDAESGSDGWRAGWVADLPDGIEPAPEGAPREDLRWFLG